MEDDLDPIIRAVQEAASLERFEYGVLVIRNNVMSCDRRPEKKRVKYFRKMLHTKFSP